MIHPSYSELMQEVNKETEVDEPPVVNSRYSIVLATSKRARQIIAGDTPLVHYRSGEKPLSIAIDELYKGEVKILPEDSKEDLEEAEDMEAIEAAEAAEDIEVTEAAEAAEAIEDTEDPEDEGTAEGMEEAE